MGEEIETALLCEKIHDGMNNLNDTWFVQRGEEFGVHGVWSMISVFGQ